MAAKKSGGGKKSGKGGRKATLRVTPVKGEASDTEVKLTRGLTVGAALQAAGISTDRKNVTIDGKPADLGATLKAGAVVNVEERPQGS